jgi:hypothetical protein
MGGLPAKDDVRRADAASRASMRAGAYVWYAVAGAGFAYSSKRPATSASSA